MPCSVPSCAKGWALLLASCVLSMWCSASSGRAQHAQSARDLFEVPESCGTQAELERELAALGRTRAAHGPAVRLSRVGEGYQLEVERAEGTRVLQDTDCRSLFRAGVLIAALEEVPQAGLQAASPSGQAEPQSQTTAEVPQAAVSPPAQPTAAIASARSTPIPGAPEAPREGAQLSGRFDAELAYGFVPAQSLALSASLALAKRRLAGRLRASYLTPRAHHEGEPGVRIDGLAAGVSLELSLTRWLRLGAGVDMLFLRGRGLSVVRARSDWATLLAGQLSLAVPLWRFSRGALELLGRGLYTARPPRFSVRAAQALYTAESFSFQGGLGVTVQFR